MVAMQAVGFTEFGGPEVLGIVDRPMPVPGPGEVLVRVMAAAVNPTDLLFRSGAQADRMRGLTPPFTPGMEFAGVVVDASGATSSLAAGDRVMGIVNPRRPGGGAQALFVAVPARSVARIDDSVAFESAASVPMSGLTAALAVAATGLTSPAVLLVTGGAGAVGGFAIQLARSAGITVAADARPDDAALLSSLGAEVVLPRGAAMAEALQQHFPGGVDAIVDAALLGAELAPLVRDGGTLVALRSPAPPNQGRVRWTSVSVTEHADDTTALETLAAQLQQGIIAARVAEVLPMSSAARAHALVARGGLRGRIVLTFDGEA